MTLTSRALVIMPNWIGDAMMALPLLQLLRSQHHELVLLVNDKVAELAAMIPDVDQVITLPFERKKLLLKARWDFACQELQEFTHAYILPNSFKSALLPYFAKIPVRIGYKGESRQKLLTVIHDDLPFQWSQQRQLNQRPMAFFYAALAYAPSNEAPKNIPFPRLAFLEKLTVPSPFEQFAIICPGAEYGSAKRWPAKHYASAIETAIGQQSEQFGILILGTGQEHPLGEAIISALPTALSAKVLNACGATSLTEAAVLISRSQWVLSNDSGLMHIAAALNIKTLGIYGPTNHWHTPPQGISAKTISLDLPCAPCQQRHCPLSGAAHHRCLKDLTPEKILHALGM